MMRRVDILASLCEEELGPKDRVLQKVAADLKSKLERPKYTELLQRAEGAVPPGESFVDRAGASAKDRAHSEVEWDEMKKEAARRKYKRFTRPKIEQDINDNRVRYRQYKDELSRLESERDKLDCMIQAAKDGVHKTRSRMLAMNKVLRDFDLADSNYAVFYGDDFGDVSYVLGKGRNAQEYHVDLVDDQLVTTPWSDYKREERKRMKEEEGSDTCDACDEDVSDLDLIPGSARIEGPEPRSELELSRNLRIIE